MSGQPADSRARPAWLTPSAAGVLALIAGDRRGVLADGPLVAHLLRLAWPPVTPDCDPLAAGRLADPALLEHLAFSLERSRTLLPMAPPADAAGRVAAAHAAAVWALDTPFLSTPPGLIAAVVRLTALGDDAAALAGRPAPDPGSAARLADRLRLPGWLVTLLATLRLPAADAAALGVPAGLTHAVRAALDPPAPVLRPVSPPRIDRDRLVQLLRATAAARRSEGRSAVAHAAVDRLASVRADFTGAVRDAKLAGLAEFAAGASHEINNPLAVIRGHAQLLLGKEADPARRAQLQVIVHQTARVHDLLQGTRQFARPPKPRRGVVDVAAVAATVLDHHRIDAARKELALSVGGPAEAVYAAADCGHVTQALTHVVRNAVDAAPAGGWVRVTVAANAEAVTFAVEDSGPGPAADHVPHLFDPFFCGRTAGRGRGLGLSIAWRLTRLNGGDVAYTPMSGGPTRFTLTLPRHAEQAGRRAA